jgi:hypothetical protein
LGPSTRFSAWEIPTIRNYISTKAPIF